MRVLKRTTEPRRLRDITVETGKGLQTAASKLISRALEGGGSHAGTTEHGIGLLDRADGCS